MAAALRLNHAKHAKELAICSFQAGDHDAPRFLIDDVELREQLGHSIGVLAFSHWWTHDELDDYDGFKDRQGAPPIKECPAEWDVDLFKLAWILRVVDACSIDGQRAPTFLKAIRKPHGESLKHWQAQQDIGKPRAESGCICFTSAKPFPLSRRDAWWLALDLARNADKELRAAEDYLPGALKFRANRVAGVASPSKFARYVRVDGWRPVETQPTISSISTVIERLGGTSLYGTDLTVPLRELIQNARDAVVFRRLLETRDPNWGKIVVTHQVEGSSNYITVTDTGIGISEENLIHGLLDFGASYWNSPLCIAEHPNSLTTGFVAEGMYGIGFFSVFMWGRHVKLVTRKPGDGQQSTRVLEFFDGASDRPVLRTANDDEQLVDPGTQITVEISDQDVIAQLLRPLRREERSPIPSHSKREKWSLFDLSQWLCPALDVDLYVSENGSEGCAVRCNDWMDIPAKDLLMRLWNDQKDVQRTLDSKLATDIANSMEPVKLSNGRVVGRATMTDLLTAVENEIESYGVVTCGSFRANRTPFFTGLLVGNPDSATRISGRWLAESEPQCLEEWATTQATHAANRSGEGLKEKVRVAAHVRYLNGNLGRLPVALYRGSPVGVEEVKIVAQDLTEVQLIDTHVYSMSLEGAHSAYNAEDPSHLGVLMGRMFSGAIIPRRVDPLARATHRYWKQYWYSLWGAVIEYVAAGWECTIDEVLSNSDLSRDKKVGRLEPDTLRRPT